MVKIRINELARELEVKPNVILDMLPGLGVTEKKTHSSSVDEPVAIEIKRRLAEEANGSSRSAPVETETAVEHAPEAPAEPCESGCASARRAACGGPAGRAVCGLRRPAHG